VTQIASVQATRLHLEAIDDGVVRLVGGHYRAVLDVGATNLSLQGEREQEALVASYAAFLNSLTFLVQILVRVLPIDIETYLADLERRAAREQSDILADLARDHVAFLRRMARSRTLLERRFYLVVPADSASREQKRGTSGVSWFSAPFSRRPRAALAASAAAKQLTFRCEEVARQLGRCGVSVRRLESTELAHLYYTCWCPERSRVQRLRRTLTEYTTLVVQQPPSHERSA